MNNKFLTLEKCPIFAFSIPESGSTAAPACPEHRAPSGCDAVDPGALQLAAVLRRDLRDRRPRRLHPERQGKGRRHEEQGTVQVGLRGSKEKRKG